MNNLRNPFLILLFSILFFHFNVSGFSEKQIQKQIQVRCPFYHFTKSADLSHLNPKSQTYSDIILPAHQ